MADTAIKTIKLVLKQHTEAEMGERAKAFSELMQARRTVRDFSDKPVSRRVIEDCLITAGSAPSGANRQPWHFAVVSDPAIKQQIRERAEEEEEKFYNDRAPQDWLDVLAPLGTDASKPFLQRAPFLIVIFSQKFGFDATANKQKNYYFTESVGIATGLLIAALHNVGLATLTHTPSPMKFLNEILARPSHEKAYLILVVGYPETDARVPDISRKSLSEIASFHEGQAQ
ncbi:MAG TPA: nitroreductase family protein [Gammaproteobacteria bacterium]|jgi:nitroreductase|nr:nitroreductase family protein [Gammaproteobacteria bacterium]|tara:strand:- start:1991 stop:2677 length:687 start_codon:yes stop_codon:yes gene_type:complete